jgi:hypothetical protein
MDVADACIVLLAQKNPRLSVLTTDRKDFTVYLATQRRLAVPLQAPAQPRNQTHLTPSG